MKIISLLTVLMAFSISIQAAGNNESRATEPRTSAPDTSSAITSLLNDAKKHFEAGESEQAAALLERALRIDPRNPILWHNLAGVRLQQEDWSRAANLASKSNTFSNDSKWLRVRNWVVIALACEGMGDKNCAQEARKRARVLAST
jgi:Flp pilus assembly protein TadD